MILGVIVGLIIVCKTIKCAIAFQQAFRYAVPCLVRFFGSRKYIRPKQGIFSVISTAHKIGFQP